MSKIEEAKQILKDLGFPDAQQNKICALTLIALCSVREEDFWVDAQRKSMTLSKGIMDFVNSYYGTDYKTNTRESFRKQALIPFVENNLVDLNPDNPTLKQTSSKTHYAISKLALETIKHYKTDFWKDAVELFKLRQFTINKPETAVLRTITISNYKSILEDTIELGRFNVFIGVNGCGKSNILEALAMIGASKANDLDFDGLYDRGVRIAKPDLTFSSFRNKKQQRNIDLSLKFEDEGKPHSIESSFYADTLDPTTIYAKWIDRKSDQSNQQIKTEVLRELEEALKNKENLKHSDLVKIVNQTIPESNAEGPTKFDQILSNYLIFTLNTRALRGIVTDSRKTPLGVNGEGLDLLIANFNNYELDHLARCSFFFDWLEDFEVDKEDKYKSAGHKLGRSTSTLYFRDKYMMQKNNLFSAENSNEGILHVLFYLALFISNKTPSLFAIDNIETALNPRLCQVLASELATLSKERGKQVLIATHSPAVLDGMNLFDPEQRLFEVYRTSEGYTKTRRIQFKENLEGKQFKLSEMWLKGVLGAVPKNF